MIALASLFLSSLFSGSFSLSNPPQDRSLSVGPMSVSWRHEEHQITFRVTSPEAGWVVLGCNDEDNILGATLYMGGYNPAGETYFSERLVTDIGKHQAFSELGLPARVQRAAAASGPSGGTILTLTLPSASRSDQEYDLRPGEELWLILAYSVSDDLGHHSRFREHVRVRL